MAAKVADLYLVYQFIIRLIKPFNETEAFKNGNIDEKGKRIKSKEIKTSKEKESYGYYDRMIFNLKKLIEKLPGGKTKLASYAAVPPLKHYDLPENMMLDPSKEYDFDVKSTVLESGKVKNKIIVFPKSQKQQDLKKKKKKRKNSYEKSTK